MKYSLPILAIAFMILVMGCKKRQDIPEPLLKYHNVTLAFSGDILEMESALFSGVKPFANGSDLYGVQVYTRKDAPATTYTPYCYGIFDDPSKISVSLLEGSLYRFEVTMIVNGKNIVPISSIDNSYRQPFMMVGGSNCSGHLSNQMAMSTTCFMSGLSQGSTAIAKESSFSIYSRPNVDRYFGRLDDFRPSVTATPSINVKRVAFGLTFEVDELRNGYLEIDIKNSPVITIRSANPNPVDVNIITFQGVLAEPMQWIMDNYTETIPVKITWFRDDGTTLEVTSQNLTFMRKYLYKVKVKLSEVIHNNNTAIVIENNVWNMGDNIIIEGK